MYHIIGYQTNPITGETLFNILCDTVADLPTSPVSDNGYGGEIGQGSKAVVIADGSSYLADSNRQWIYQPNPNAWVNVYTKLEIDEMITEIYETIAYYHTTLVSDNGEITFYAFAGYIGTWSIFGNGSQSGTPTPDAPIMPEFVGVRTGNLCAIPSVSANFGNLTVAANGDAFSLTGTVTEISRSNNFWKRFDFVLSAGDYVIKLGVPRSYQSGYSAYLVEYDTGTTLASISGASSSAATFTLTNDTHVYIGFYIYNKTLSDDKWILMLNLGSTALPYEPYGYKIPLTCAGQTVPVYLGQTQTVRRIGKLVLTGEETFSAPYSNSIFYASSSGIGILSHINYEVICSHFVRSETNAETQMQDGRVVLSTSAIYMRMDAAATTADFKAYLAQQYAAGTPVVVWYVLATEQTGIVNEPLCRIGDYADELLSADAGVTIPTVKGENTLTVDTILKPSRIEIQG